jgi:hypothetical protein
MDKKAVLGDLKFDDFYGPTHTFFKVVGIDFDIRQRTTLTGRVKRALMTSYAIYGVFSLLVMFMNRILQLPTIVNEGFDEIIKAMFNIIPLPVSAFQTVFFMLTKQEVNAIVEMLRSSYPTLKKDQDKYQIAEPHKSLMKFVKFYIGITSLLMFVFSLATISKMVQDGVKVNEETWLPEFIDRRNPYVFAVLGSMLFWVTFGCVIPQCASNLIIGVLVSAIAIQFEILRVDIREALNRPNLKMKDFKNLIMRHNQLINISNRLRHLFSLILILEFIQSSLIICLTSAQLLFLHGVDFIAFIINFVFSFIHYYIPFYYGQKLYDSSQVIVDAVTSSAWYNIKDKDVRKALVPMIQCASNARYLTGFDFIIIYRKTYRKVSGKILS